MNKRSIYGLTMDEWEDFVVTNGQPKFRAAQIFDWLYVKQVASFDEMLNVPKALKALMTNVFDFTTFEVVRHQEASDGTHKFLFRLPDKNTIETVLMKHAYGLSICVTTQIGCRIGCSFCASTIGGLVRNLEAGEIVGQVVHVARALQVRIGHVVVMGIGEPFENYGALTNFIHIINHDKGLNIGARHITVSTSGIVPKIYEFADDHKQVSLAISLHAPNDHLRTTIMKINRAYPLSDLMKAVRYYLKETKRRITFEYILMKDVNDLDEYAYQLAKLIKGMNCHVNLIPMNAVAELGLSRSSKSQVMRFKEILEKEKVNVTVRREMGANIDAACGQLRATERARQRDKAN
ncbi:MAG: 23S rRNA (adenine(2503)-C(2))-methyltransferase RlmN [Defluviitaleaceae bacterium]|nr:23S rRNA (adenine(2503)-C(2))-methyltransferase RlmN [Defluviitaleaceae bacterium]